ncbi:MAG: 4Fe-4S binding protein, partial [Thiohalocapsa sp.]
AGQGRAAARAYLDRGLDDALDVAFERFAELTGRWHRSVSTYRIEDAKLVLLAVGSVIETAEAAADRLRARYRTKVGVVGLRRLHPFPSAELARLIGRSLPVCVLECVDVPLSDDPPLLSQVRAALDRACDNHKRGAETHPGYPVLARNDHPRLLSVIHGVGGLPLRTADLLRLCRDLDRLTRPRVYLGVDFGHAASGYPKRQVMLDRLRLAYPEVADLGVRELGLAAGNADEDLRPAGAMTLAVQRRSGAAGSELAVEAAVLFNRIDGGGLRGRPDLFEQPWGQICVDRITSAAQDVREPGDDCPVDLCLLLSDHALPTAKDQIALIPNGMLLVQTALPEERLWARLSDDERARLKDGTARLYVLPPAHESNGSSSPDSSPHTPPDVHGVQAGDQLSEYLLGAICALLMQQGLMDLTRRRLLGLRGEMLRQSGPDAEERISLFEAGLDAPRQVDIARLPRAAALGSVDRVDQAPALVRRIGGSQNGCQSLPRFWDRIGVLYRNGDTAELSPDPAFAVGAVPALSAGFRDLSPLRERLPLFDPDLCTSCGACWSACPESAVAAVAVTPKQVIDAGIQAGGADALLPLASKLAAGVAQLCRQTEYAPSTAAELIDSAYAQLEARLPFPEERKQAMAEGLGKLLSSIGPAPLVATEGLFRAPESANPGTGALLALSVNPDTCKACGLCIAVCAPTALRAERQGRRHLSDARQVRVAWERLPDTEPEVIARAAALAEPGALAARLL